MKRLISICVVTAFLFSLFGCTNAQQSKSPNYNYNWSAPLEQVTWGMNEKSVLESLKLQSSDVEKSSDGKVLTLKKPLTLFGAETRVAIHLNDKYGVSEIDAKYDSAALNKVLPELKKRYGEPSGTSGGAITEDAAYQWIGTDVKALDSAAQKHFQAVLKKSGASSNSVNNYMKSPLPLVTIDFDCSKNSPARGLCRFTGGKAAVLETSE